MTLINTLCLPVYGRDVLRQRRHLATLVIAALAASQVFGQAQSPSTPAPCDPPYQLKQNGVANAAANTTPDANGVVHISYSGSTDPSIDKAFAAWNQYSSSTGIQFDRAASGGTVSVLNDNSVNCLVTYENQANPAIYFNDHFATSMLGTTAPPRADTVLGFQHEIGHLLGFNERRGLTGKNIMNQSSGCIKGDPGYQWNVQAVQASDAQAVGTASGGCQNVARKVCIKCKH